MRRSSRSLWLAPVIAVLAACGGGGGDGDAIPPFPLYTSVAVADLDGDGTPDIATCYSIISGAPPHPGFVAVYLQDRAQPGTFLPPATYSSDSNPEWIAIGDLNGDDHLDMVTANTTLRTDGIGPNDVSVLLQDASSPGRFLPARDFATGKSPDAVAIGDLNGDGSPDLAVADSGGISLLFQDGDTPGTFLPRTTLGVGSGTSSVAIADLNGDSEPDLAATNATNILVLLQDAAMPGTFLPAASYGAGSQPIAVAVADLDGDGKSDLGIANIGTPQDGSTARASVLLQDPAAPGNFLHATNYQTGIRSGFLAIADLDGDGRADLAVANNGNLAGDCPPDCVIAGASVSVLLQDAVSSGRFQATTNYTGTDQVLSVAPADMNGDTKPDLAIAQAGGIVIRFQDPANPGMFLPLTIITN